jgi:hypothetical protein
MAGFRFVYFQRNYPLMAVLLRIFCQASVKLKKAVVKQVNDYLDSEDNFLKL